ncbi:MAG TPA: hypothetical protein H9762_01555 [Candidatus Ligilactobacillus avistercoris]|nr:hypothetical protein [Candidatus Ligilactobacillus avistercoris]
MTTSGKQATADIVPAQVVKLGKHALVLKTETNELITVTRPRSTAHDSVFLKVMRDIMHTGLWIPVDRKNRHILRYDWFDTPIENYSF